MEDSGDHSRSDLEEGAGLSSLRIIIRRGQGWKTLDSSNTNLLSVQLSWLIDLNNLHSHANCEFGNLGRNDPLTSNRLHLLLTVDLVFVLRCLLRS